MEKEPITQGQEELTDTPPSGDVVVDVDPHEVAQRGQSVIELSRELNSSSKALLEQINPVA